MSLSIGGIDLTDSIINTEFRLGVLERVVDRLLRVAPLGTVTDADMKKIRDEVLQALQKKYPEAGITTKNG